MVELELGRDTAIRQCHENVTARAGASWRQSAHPSTNLAYLGATRRQLAPAGAGIQPLHVELVSLIRRVRSQALDDPYFWVKLHEARELPLEDRRLCSHRTPGEGYNDSTVVFGPAATGDPGPARQQA